MDPRRGSVAESQQVGSTGAAKSVGQNARTDHDGLGKSNRNQFKYLYLITGNPADKSFNNQPHGKRNVEEEVIQLTVVKICHSMPPKNVYV